MEAKVVNSVAKELIEWGKAIVIALIIAYLFMHVFTMLQVFDISMNPTLVEGDRLLLYNTHDVKKGDIVIYETEIPLTETEMEHMSFIQKMRNGKYKTLIKRVVAVAGDSVEIRDGKVFINDDLINEPYILDDYTTGDVLIDKIPEGQIFTMGDNRSHSHDSRSDDIGPVDVQKVKGKVIFRFWPFNKFGGL